MNIENETENNDTTPAGGLNVEEAQIWKRDGFDDLPLVMSVPVVGGYLGVSKSTAYNLRKAGIIRTRRFGARLVVTRWELFRLLHGPDSSAVA